MTTVADSPATPLPPPAGPSRLPVTQPSVVRPGLGRCLGRLTQAIDAARAMGFDASAAEAVLASIRERLGFPSTAYVLALVGGTGVGKSSILNALAGEAVSRAGARRPTTSTPVAWIPSSAVEDLAPLVDRLGEVERRVHAGDALADVVILDLPDLDSIDPDHRARVEEVLPRVDAVAWVIDPEKYADARLHDEFLRTWLPRLDRQVFVLNKADRLPEGASADVEADLAGTIRRETDGRAKPVPIVVVSAAGGSDGVAPLRAWLEAARDTKAVIAGRLAALARDTVLHLAAAAGADPAGPADSLVDPETRRTALRGAIDGTLALVDLPGAERRAVAATRARARPVASGPFGRLTSLLYRASGRQRRAADPASHLAGWRGRGSLARPVDAVRGAVAVATGRASPAMRPLVAAAGDSGMLAGRIARSVDRVLADRGELPAPRSRVWPLLGFLQTVTVIAIAVSVGWLVVWLLGRTPADSFTLPVVGLVPAPYAVVVATVVAGFVLARAASIHAGWVGRRWARRLRTELEAELSAAIEEALAPLDRIDVQRRAIWIAARGAEEECG